MADRYTYLPQIGLALAVAWGAKNFAGSRPPRLWACAAASVVAVAALMAAHGTNLLLDDSETLWHRASDCTANNVLAHNNIAIILANATGWTKRSIIIGRRWKSTPVLL